MDRIEKILVFVVVATIVVIVTLALSNSGEGPPGSLPAKSAPMADGREPVDLPLIEADPGAGPRELVAHTPAPDPQLQPGPQPAGGPEPPGADGAPPTAAEPAEPAKPAPAPKPAWDSRYVVQKGDSFWSIAEAKYMNGKHWTLIRDHNKDVDPDNVQPGTVLVLPPLETVVKAVRTPTLEMAGGGDFRTVTLQKGEHIYAVLRREHLTHRYDEILRLNHLDRAAADRVTPGFVLKLPAK
ncbi:MAG: LysM peptidoglycan-binding domain-containing protein [Planctomycetes bacterium]|nr:LysM peptidoglycan-binding domain-containing protein [Planctomycetota bacterium]